MIFFPRPRHAHCMRLRSLHSSSAPARLLALVALAALPALAGCTHVRPYERGALARPTMTAAPLTGAGEEHLYSVHEGASGGGGGGGGGCGCN